MLASEAAFEWFVAAVWRIGQRLLRGRWTWVDSLVVAPSAAVLLEAAECQEG